jgi:hypothetical protein
MPRLGGVAIAVYPQLTGGATPTVGAVVASTVTGTDGKFTLPTLPGGMYVVTFTPPNGSVYGGVWVTATAYDGSSEYPWWVVLPRK